MPLTDSLKKLIGISRTNYRRRREKARAQVLSFVFEITGLGDAAMGIQSHPFPAQRLFAFRMRYTRVILALGTLETGDFLHVVADCLLIRSVTTSSQKLYRGIPDPLLKETP